jgi:hypothetical protein
MTTLDCYERALQAIAVELESADEETRRLANLFPGSGKLEILAHRICQTPSVCPTPIPDLSADDWSQMIRDTNYYGEGCFSEVELAEMDAPSLASSYLEALQMYAQSQLG